MSSYGLVVMPSVMLKTNGFGSMCSVEGQNRRWRKCTDEKRYSKQTQRENALK